MPLCRYRQANLALETHRRLIRAGAPDQPEAGDERLRDAGAGHPHRLVQEVFGHVRGDPTSLGHIAMLTSVMTCVNTPQADPGAVRNWIQARLGIP